jgi:hypothetical protein
VEMWIPTFGVLLDRFIESEMPERYSTRDGIPVHDPGASPQPRWGDYPLDRLRPMVIEQEYSKAYVPLDPDLRRLCRRGIHRRSSRGMRIGSLPIRRLERRITRMRGSSATCRSRSRNR